MLILVYTAVSLPAYSPCPITSAEMKVGLKDCFSSSAVRAASDTPCDRALVALPTPHAPQRLRLVLDRVGRHRVDTFPLDDAPSLVRLAVATVSVRSDDPFMCHKTTRRAVYDRALATHPTADDALLVNERDEVVETTVANLLYRIGDQWYTPPLSSGGLPGVGREVLVAGGEVSERVLPLCELMVCDEVAVVNSLRGRRSAEILVG